MEKNTFIILFYFMNKFILLLFPLILNGVFGNLNANHTHLTQFLSSLLFVYGVETAHITSCFDNATVTTFFNFLSLSYNTSKAFQESDYSEFENFYYKTLATQVEMIETW